MSSKNRIRFFNTISVKIASWYLLSVLLILLFTGIFLYYRLRHTLNKETDNILLDESEYVAQSIQKNSYTTEDLIRLIEIKSSSKRYLRTSIRLYDTEQSTFIGSESFFAPDLKRKNHT